MDDKVLSEEVSLGIWSRISITLAPGKQKAVTDFFLMFLMIKSQIMSVVGGGGDGAGNCTHNDGMDGEELTERGIGVIGYPRGTDVKCAVE